MARCELAVSKACVAVMQACQDAQEATVVNVRDDTRGVVVFTGEANLRSWSASDGRRAAAAGSGGWNPGWTVPSTHVRVTAVREALVRRTEAAVARREA